MWCCKMVCKRTFRYQLNYKLDWENKRRGMPHQNLGHCWTSLLRWSCSSQRLNSKKEHLGTCSASLVRRNFTYRQRWGHANSLEYPLKANFEAVFLKWCLQHRRICNGQSTRRKVVTRWQSLYCWQLIRHNFSLFFGNQQSSLVWSDESSTILLVWHS